MGPHFFSLLIGLSYISTFILQASHACFHWPKPKPHPKKDYSACDCYTVSGPDAGYFQNYQFWDFRNVPLPQEQDEDYSRDREEDYYGDLDDQVEGYGNHLHALLLANTSFSKDWQIQEWRRDSSLLSPVPMVNSKKNVFIARNPELTHGADSTFLILRTTRFKNHTSAAEIESTVRNIFHCSLRVRLRILAEDDPVVRPSPDEEEAAAAAANDAAIFPRGRRQYNLIGGNETATHMKLPPTGACAGVFTWHSKDCESDIEILTSDPPGRIRYANQPDYDPVTDRMIPGASKIADIPVPWTSWATHRLDWLSTVSQWYVDNQLTDSRTYRVPDRASMIALNLWSDGGQWSGDLAVNKSVHMAIEWIEIVYNVTTNMNDHPVGVPLMGQPDRNLGAHFLVEPAGAPAGLKGDGTKTRGCKVTCRID